MISVGLACLAVWGWAQSSSTSSADQNGGSSAATSELQQATEVIQQMTTTAPDKAIPPQMLAEAKCSSKETHRCRTRKPEHL